MVKAVFNSEVMNAGTRALKGMSSAFSTAGDLDISINIIPGDVGEKSLYESGK